MHVLHAIHDFPPRHRAGSELYALGLARAQAARHHVTVLCADYDLAREHGDVDWRLHEGIPVVEIINNWRCASFTETYRPPLVGERIRQTLETLRPDVVHVHNLLNLSFDLPRIANGLGIPVVATLHDYTLLCASGGQRVHKQEQHVCVDIEADRCARCFAESPQYMQTAFGRATSGGRAGAAAKFVARTGLRLHQIAPGLVERVARVLRRAGGPALDPRAFDARMAAAHEVFSHVDVFVAPSQTLAQEFVRFGLPADRLRVSDYGRPRLPIRTLHRPRSPLRIGLVGTLVWHKGVHILIEALKQLPRTGHRTLIYGPLDTFRDYVGEIRRRAAGLPVELMGAFANDQAADIYRELDVLVVPSLWPENSPLVIHEAFQAGVPVVASRIGGIPGLVTHGVNGLLVEPGSIPDLSRALASLLEDPSLVTRLGAAAPPVKSIDDDAAEWDVVYSETLSRRRRRTA